MFPANSPLKSPPSYISLAERNRDIGWQFGQALIPRDTDYIIFEVRLPVPTTGVLDDRADVAIDDVWISQGSCNAGGETCHLC